MRRFFFLSILLLPVFSFAAIQGGFPTQAIWVSKSSAIEGETIVISTVVYNGDSGVLHGTLVFTADGTRIGAREFELPEGGSQIHSIEWKPKRGEYRIMAQIEGTSAALSQRETPSILVSIAAPPPPSAVQQTISQVVRTATTIASSSAPVVVQAAQAVFAQTEAIRNAGIEKLEKYLASHSTQTSSGKSSAASPQTSQGTVAGSSTSTPGSNVAGFRGSEEKGIRANIAQAAAAAALFTLKSAALFYPLLAFLFFGILYWLARRVRRQPRD